MVDNELEVARNFTWAVLGMEDGNFWHLGGATRWNSRFLIHTLEPLTVFFLPQVTFFFLQYSLGANTKAISPLIWEYDDEHDNPWTDLGLAR